MGIADFMRVFQINQKTLIIISDYQGFAYLLMLSHKDSNLDRQIQKLQCYHYTMRQYLFPFF